jgi:hypothetical protein
MNQQTNSPAYYSQQQPTPTGASQVPPGSNPPGPASQQPSAYQVDLDVQNDGLVDPVMRSKELYIQLGNSLKQLLTHLSFVLNPSNENK